MVMADWSTSSSSLSLVPHYYSVINIHGEGLRRDIATPNPICNLHANKICLN